MSDPELTPLLEHATLDGYGRFTNSRRKGILAIVSWAALIPFLVSGSFLPSIPEIAKDMHSDETVVSFAVSLSVFTASIGSMTWATYSAVYGRRRIYMFSMPTLCIGSLGVASAQNVPMLMFCRIVQAWGASSGWSVGAGVIADIYRLEERGTAMGIFAGASLLGPALSPVLGGFTAHYFSWRYMQLGLALGGLSVFLLVGFFLPETLNRSHGKVIEDDFVPSSKKFVFLNPFRCLRLLKSPNLLATTLVTTAALTTDFVLLMPIAYTIGERYNISNAALIGAFFLPTGIGNVLGAPLAGWLSDRSVVSWKAKRGGQYVPEDRLRSTLFGACFCVPVSILLSGIVTTYVDGHLGIVLNLICLFINGIGVDLVLCPCAAYAVDIFLAHSAEAGAACSGLRSAIIALISTMIFPMLHTFGLLKTDIFFAIFAWLGFIVLWLTIRYGREMHAWVDLPYSVPSHPDPMQQE